MSSCCLAACGRLAENSQSGEAGFNPLWTGSPGTSAPSAAAAAPHSPAVGPGFGQGRGLPAPTAAGIFCRLPLAARRAAGRRGKSCLSPTCPSLSHSRLALSVRAAPSRRVSGRGTGARALPALPTLGFSPPPSPWTCVLFPTLPKIIAIQAWCVQAVSCYRGGGRRPGVPHPSTSRCDVPFAAAPAVSCGVVGEGPCSGGSATNPPAARGPLRGGTALPGAQQ